MKKQTLKIIRLVGLASLVIALSLSAATCSTSVSDQKSVYKMTNTANVVVYLRAEPFTVTMPDSRVVTMWGYALDSSFGARDGTLMSPGPTIQLQELTNQLTIQLDNNLPEPTSVVIDSLISTMTPVRHPDGRVRSFTHETPPGNTQPISYVFNSLRPGTFLYKSGTSPQVQVQMGLAGAISRLSAPGVAYPGKPFDEEVTMVYSEIDPALHDAVATGNYGPGRAVTSTLKYVPRYFLINGVPIMSGAYEVSPTRAGRKILFRIVSAALLDHAPLFYQTYASSIAEDGFLAPNSKEVYSLFLPAGKTRDAILTGPDSGAYLIFDRMF